MPGLARDEALLTALYGIAVLVPPLCLRTATDRLRATMLIGAVLAALAVAVGVRLAVGDPASPPLFRDQRLFFPITYANAGAALFLLGFWPCVVAAARRSAHTALRALFLGGAGALLAAALLAQSKGAMIGLAASAIALLAVSPARLRLAVPALLPVAIVAVFFSPLTGPFRADGASELAGAIVDAGTAVLAAAALGAVAGAVYAYADRRLELSARFRRNAGRAALALVVLAVAGALAGFFVGVERPGHFLAQKWDSFKTLPERETTSTHLLTLGSNRYDFWRVSAHEIADHPFFGIGSRGFLNLYLAEGKSIEQPARVHSLPLEVLLEDGIVGFALLALALALPLVAAATRTRIRKLPATAAFGAGAGWLVHASVDWTWTFPAVGLPAFLLLGIALARDEQRTVPFRVGIPAAAVAVALAVVAFGATWRSLDLTQDAISHPPGVARTELERARQLDPFSADPLLAEGRIAPTAAESLAIFREAARREPRSIAARYCLVVTSVEAGERDEARRELPALLRLARPVYAFVQDAERAVARGGGAPSCRV